MKLLTATRQTQGERPGDFCHAVEGELVLIEFVCARDRRDPGGGCGCGRAFAGMSSHRATTTALVRELELTPDEVELAVASYYATGGSGPEVLGEHAFAEVVSEAALDVIGLAQWFPFGTVVERRLDDFSARTAATPT